MNNFLNGDNIQIFFTSKNFSSGTAIEIKSAIHLSMWDDTYSSLSIYSIITHKNYIELFKTLKTLEK